MSGVELVWTRTHAVLTTAIASVAVSTWLFQSGGAIVTSVREGVAREPARLVGALSSLADYVHATYGISGSIVRGILFSAVLVGVVWGYMHVSNLVQAQLQRKKVSIATFLKHAKNFRHAQNGACGGGCRLPRCGGGGPVVQAGEGSRPAAAALRGGCVCTLTSTATTHPTRALLRLLRLHCLPPALQARCRRSTRPSMRC